MHGPLPINGPPCPDCGVHPLDGYMSHKTDCPQRQAGRPVHRPWYLRFWEWLTWHWNNIYWAEVGWVILGVLVGCAFIWFVLTAIESRK